MTLLGRGYLDAVMAAGAVVAKGAEDLGAAWLAFVQTSADQSVATAKAVATAKSMQEVVDLQNVFAKNALDGFFAESRQRSLRAAERQGERGGRDAQPAARRLIFARSLPRFPGRD